MSSWRARELVKASTFIGTLRRMRSWGLWLSASLVLMACEISVAEATRRVQSRGYSEVAVTGRGGGEFDFTAKKEGDACTGHLKVSSNREDFKVTCVATRTEPVPTTLARPSQSMFTAAYEACVSGDKVKCSDLGRGLMQTDRSHPESGLPFLERGCELEDGAGCVTLAQVLDQGQLVEADHARATSLNTKACKLGAVNGCLLAARHLDEAHQPQQAIDLLTPQCAASHGPSCLLLGDLTLRGAPPAGAEAFFRQACTAKEGMGCVRLAASSAAGEAVALLRTACELDTAEGCNQLGASFEQGRGTARAPAEALRSFHRACELKLGAGCRNKGRMLAIGLGQKKDAVAAANFFRLGCELGDGESCEHFGDHARACELGFAAACPK